MPMDLHTLALNCALNSGKGKTSPYVWSEGDEGETAYGLQYLHNAREQGKLVIEEGESDWATLSFHGIPALGIPGATAVNKTLDASLLKDIPVIYVIQEETDQAGIDFPYLVQKRLKETGYQWQILRVPLRTLTGVKDPNELHKQLCNRMGEEQSKQPFWDTFQKALDQAKEMNSDTGTMLVDLLPVQKAIAEKDAKALLKTVDLLAQMSREDYASIKLDIRDAFPKGLSFRELDAAVNEKRKAANTSTESSEIDLDHVAQAFYDRLC